MFASDRAERKLANIGDEARANLDIEAMIAKVDASAENVEFIESISRFLECIAPTMLPYGRPAAGKIVTLYNKVRELYAIHHNLSEYEIIEDETDEYRRTHHYGLDKESILDRMEAWCDDGKFQSAKSLAVFFRDLITESELTGDPRYFVNSFTDAFYDLQGIEFLDEDNLGFDDVAMCTGENRLFDLDENLDMIWIPEALEAAKMFVARHA